MRILGVSGSLRADSYNTNLLRAAAEAAPQGVELVVWEGLREIPPYDADLDVEPAPEPVRRLRDAIAGADALLFATPEYNGSVPGQLKNAIDWASRPFPESALRGRPAAVVGAVTGSFGGVWAQADLRKILSTAGARVLEAAVPVPKAAEAFDEQGRLLSPETRTALHGLVTELMAEANPVPAAA
jgi:chromate reductase, NAD(P)H dehydrogenase (quinone)